MSFEEFGLSPELLSGLADGRLEGGAGELLPLLGLGGAAGD